MGDDCGVLRRTKVEMGVFAMKSGWARFNFSGRLCDLRPRAEDRRPTDRDWEPGQGEGFDERFGCSRRSSSLEITAGMLPLLV